MSVRVRATKITGQVDVWIHLEEMRDSNSFAPYPDFIVLEWTPNDSVSPQGIYPDPMRVEIPVAEGGWYTRELGNKKRA